MTFLKGLSKITARMIVLSVILTCLQHAAPPNLGRGPPGSFAAATPPFPAENSTAPDADTSDSLLWQVKRRWLLASSACQIRDFNLHFTEAAQPNQENPLQIVLPIFVLVDGLSPANATLDDVELDLTCTVGSPPGPTRNGTLARKRSVERGFLIDCEIVVNNDDDCEWNVIQVSGSASLQGTTCVRRARAAASYCRKELSSEGRLFSARGPGVEICKVDDFNVEVMEPRAGGSNASVVFPLRTVIEGMRYPRQGVEWTRSCSRGGENGVIANARIEDGVELFDCVMEAVACDGVPVVVDVVLGLRGEGGGVVCTRSARREIEYCGEAEKNATKGSEGEIEMMRECMIGDFNVHYLSGQELIDEKAVVFPAHIFFGRIQPPEMANDTEIGIKCFLTTGSSETIAGVSTNATEVRIGEKGEVNFGCMFEIDVVANCSTIWVEASIRIPGNGATVEGCERRALSNRSACPNAEPSPVPLPPMPSPRNPPKCTISSYNITFDDSDVVNQDGSLKIPFVAVLGRVEPMNSSSTADFDFECTQIPGPRDRKKLVGTVKSQYSQGKVSGFCIFDHIPSQCNTTLEIHSKVSVAEGKDYDGCKKVATDRTEFCFRSDKPYESKINQEANPPVSSTLHRESPANQPTLEVLDSEEDANIQTYLPQDYGLNSPQEIHTHRYDQINPYHECMINHLGAVFLPWERTGHRLIQVSFDILTSGYRPQFHFYISCFSSDKKAYTEIIEEYQNGFVFECASEHHQEIHQASVSVDILMGNGFVCKHRTIAATH